VKSYGPLGEKNGNVVYIALCCLPTSKLMERPDGIEVIFCFKMTEARVERREAEHGFRKLPLNFHSQRVSVREKEK